MKLLHIAAYKFVTLHDLSNLRGIFRQTCQNLQLKGTILLSHEGINLMLAGTPSAIAQFTAFLETQAVFQGMSFRENPCEEMPFKRMWVKLKKEIITMGTATILPETIPAPRITPKELKQWLDEGRDITLLDTRNEYEISVGTFKNAINPHLKHFRHFPAAVPTLDPTLKHKPVIAFCTGGIRCEKAALVLQQEGFEQVYQLDGGILKYFEECGNAHYQGECFVFDNRMTVRGE
jgi:UPF0176 protein